MTLEFDVTGDDLRELVRAVRKTARGRHDLRRGYWNGLRLGLFPLTFVALILILGRSPLAVHGLLVGIPAVAYAAAWSGYFAYELRRSAEQYAAPQEGFGLGPHRLELREDGIAESLEKRQTIHSWSLTREVIEAPEHVFVSVLHDNYFVVPKRAFGSPSEIASFLETLREKMERPARA